MRNFIYLAVITVIFACNNTNKTPKKFYYSIAFTSSSKSAQYSNVFTSTCSDADLTNLAKSTAEGLGYTEFKLEGPKSNGGDAIADKEDSKKAFQGTGFAIGTDFTFPKCP